jgi:undecaprenyl-diphosphatase
VPFVLDLIAAGLAGTLALLVARWYLASDLPDDPAREAAEAIGEAARQESAVRRLVATRLDRRVATGLLLTAALGVTVLGGVVLGSLAYLVHRWPAVQHLDNSVAQWGYEHRTSASTTGLKAITQLGNIRVVVALAVLLALADLARTRGRWTALFLLVILGGMEAISTGVKHLVDRPRPLLYPGAAELGPSFPSGHSATAATFYAAAALVAGRWAAKRTRIRELVAAAAVAIAVAVAGSRVLIDVHWLSDVIGGIALGWAWFALVAIVFGGRLLRPTAAADVAAEEAPDTKPRARLPAKRSRSTVSGR